MILFFFAFLFPVIHSLTLLPTCGSDVSACWSNVANMYSPESSWNLCTLRSGCCTYASECPGNIEFGQPFLKYNGIDAGPELRIHYLKNEQLNSGEYSGFAIVSCGTSNSTKRQIGHSTLSFVLGEQEVILLSYPECLRDSYDFSKVAISLTHNPENPDYIQLLTSGYSNANFFVEGIFLFENENFEKE
jgi:hypothetical protein